MMFMGVEMDIKKVREAFEKLPEIRDSLSEHIVFIGSKYTTPNPDFYDLVNWLNGAWYAWQAKAQAVPEGFVLVPKKPDVDKAWSIALKRIVPPPKTNDAIQKELMCKKYVDDLYSEQDRILLDYEAMIEAQEQSNA